MPSNVQILKESKARFEGVIFNQTADLGTNKSTSCKVIDEATGEVIAQSGGGGGGESDFSTATLKVRFVNAGDGALEAENVFAISGLPLYISGEQNNYSTGSVSVISDAEVAVGEYKELEAEVILYKGTCVGYPMFSSRTMTQNGSPVKVEGDVTVDQMAVTITGDCTISVNVEGTK